LLKAQLILHHPCAISGDLPSSISATIILRLADTEDDIVYLSPRAIDTRAVDLTSQLQAIGILQGVAFSIFDAEPIARTDVLVCAGRLDGAV